MGHNVDLTEFGITHLKCRYCFHELDLTELDIDCDLRSKVPKKFTITPQCHHCHENPEYTFKLVLERESCE